MERSLLCSLVFYTIQYIPCNQSVVSQLDIISYALKNDNFSFLTLNFGITQKTKNRKQRNLLSSRGSSMYIAVSLQSLRRWVASPNCATDLSNVQCVLSGCLAIRHFQYVPVVFCAGNSGWTLRVTAQLKLELW
jgi:hypothetical protein